MEGKNRYNILIRKIVIVMVLFLISSPSFIINADITADSPKTSTRSGDELVWTQTTQEDFMNGTVSTLNNGSTPSLEVTPTGEVKLAMESKMVEDDYRFETKISYKNNLQIGWYPPGIPERAVRLLTNDDVIINETFGGANHDSAKSVQETPDGGYILIGGTASYGVDGGDVWLIKIDSSGNEQWNRTFNRDVYDGGSCIQVTSDDGYILAGHTGTFSGGTQDIWLIKTDSLGIEDWNRTFDNSGKTDEGYSVKETSDGGYIVVGKTVISGSGDFDIWLIKTDSLGIEDWNKTFNYNGKDDEGYSVMPTLDGGYIIVGMAYISGSGDIDIWLIKTDSSGNEEWNKTFGGSDAETGYSVQQTSDGGYVITGVVRSFGNGREDVWLIKTDISGNEQWNKTFGGGSDDIGKSVQITSDGGYILGGWTKSYSAQSYYDGWIIKTDSSGIEQWNRSLGGDDVEEFSWVQQTSGGEYVAVGGTTSYGAGDYDAWLIKIYAPENVPDSSGEFVSTNLLEGQAACTIDSFSYRASIPLETGIRAQFSQDYINWYDSSGNLNNWDILSDGINNIDLSNLAWSGSNFYYKMNFTSNTTDTPLLYNMTFSYREFYQNGTLESEPFDSETYPHWKRFNWTATMPSDTELKFQLRTTDMFEELGDENFVGPNGSSETHYTTSDQPIWESHERDRYIQYIVYFSTSNTSVSPILEEVSIIYEPIDTDDDGVEDFIDQDDDNDGMPDLWESQYGLNPLNQSDENLDPDLDYLTNLQEFYNYTNPNNNETDGDNLGDGFEVIFSKTNASNWDTNGNGIGDGLEFIQKQGYLGWIGSLPNDWIGMTISWENYTIYVKTNSSVLEGEFDKEELELKIKVSGPEGTQGVTKLDIPKGLCDPNDIEIEFDGELINFTLTEDDDYYYIHIEYNHSVHELSASFSQITEIPDQPIDSNEKGLFDDLPLLGLIIAIIVIILLLILITRNNNRKDNIGVQELPPEKLAVLLEQKHDDGEMTDETYNDIKTLLEKYNGG